MSFSPSSPVTGAAITGLTSPTYTLTADTAPAANAKQYYVSALGGTQAGVTTHSVGSPFTLSMWRPLTLQIVSFFNSFTGFTKKNPKNSYKVITRKGVTPVAGAAVEVALCTVTIEVPAGAESYDAVNVKALLSAAFGATWATAQGISDTAATGTL